MSLKQIPLKKLVNLNYIRTNPSRIKICDGEDLENYDETSSYYLDTFMQSITYNEYTKNKIIKDWDIDDNGDMRVILETNF